MNKILVIGAVATTKHTINQLVKHGFNVVGVLGHEPKDSATVSGWANLRTQSEGLNVPFQGFQRINDPKHIEWAKEKQPDIIFAVGFSQLLAQEWLQMPVCGCIGFHPTHLPKGRGRAPLAWIILEKAVGSATFFMMGEGADDGPIFVQEVFELENEDNASTVEGKIENAIIVALDKWLPELKQGVWNPVPQDELAASWYGKRSIEDGHIDWNKSNIEIDRLIKASSSPHPGAYTYFKDQKMIIWDAELEMDFPIRGVIGRVLIVDSNKGWLIQCGIGLLWIKSLDFPSQLDLKVGDKLGYNIEDELCRIKNILKKMKYD